MNPQRYKRSTLIKFCGITNVQDAISAIEVGADLIGLNLVGGPRKIMPAAAEQIAAHPELVGKEVVLLDHWPPAWVVSAPLKTTIFGVQFYGPVGHPAVAQIRQQPFKLHLPVRVENTISLTAIDGQRADCAQTVTSVSWLMKGNPCTLRMVPCIEISSSHRHTW